MNNQQTLTIKGETLVLHASGAVYWPARKAVLIADVHIGKVDHFRKEGIAVPAHAQQTNYDKLNDLLETFAPEKIYFLGDLFHSKRNRDWDTFFRWMDEKNLEYTLVMGNHDRHDQAAIKHSQLRLSGDLILSPFYLSHHPLEDSEGFNICGHIHPGVVLRGKGKLMVKSACFAKYKNQLILPAFGTFTGLHILDPKACQRIFMIADGEVIDLG